MNKDLIKMSILAIVGGVFAVLFSGVSALSLVTPVMSIIVGQAAHSFGLNKKTINTMIVLIVLTFFIVLPYLESHPMIAKKVLNNCRATTTRILNLFESTDHTRGASNSQNQVNVDRRDR